jgi:cold shock CspA family protein
MEIGVIKMIDPIQGFGFIYTEGEDEVYFNFKDIHPKFRNVKFKEGDSVGFDLRREMQGDRAVNVRLK